jgi:SAM-dependent methyltransferase
VSFEVAGDAYDRFMGRWSRPLAAEFVELADARPGRRALDVGCGPGALTAELVDRLGQEAVAAADPSAAFVHALHERFPRVDARSASAEHLPWPDAGFDVAAAQLVVHFMTDPVAGLAEMARVVRPGGIVTACVWDHAGSGGPLADFWRAVHDLDPEAVGESELPGTAEGQLERLATAAGLRDVEGGRLSVSLHVDRFQDWWEPFTLGVGPAGDYVAGLDRSARERLLAHYAEVLPVAPFTLDAVAWTVRARRR